MNKISLSSKEYEDKLYDALSSPEKLKKFFLNYRRVFIEPTIIIETNNISCNYPEITI